MNRVLALSNEKKMFTDFRKRMGGKINLKLAVYSDALALIENFASFHTQLVILDLDLLDRRILKLIKVLRNIQKDVKIIAILSKEKLPVCPEVLSMGIVSYIIKPISLKILSDLIISILNIQLINN